MIDYIIEMEIDTGCVETRDIFVSAPDAETAIESAFDRLYEEFKGQVAFFTKKRIYRAVETLKTHLIGA